MAANNQNLEIGPADVYVSPWVTGGGAGTFVEMGHTKEPSKCAPSYENFKLESEQSLGTVLSLPVKDEWTITFSPMEMTILNLRLALGQAAGRISGNTLHVGDRDGGEFKQVKLVQTRQLPTPFVSLTVIYWRCIVSAHGEIPLAKNDVTSLSPTFDVIRDDTYQAGTFFSWQLT